MFPAVNLSSILNFTNVYTIEEAILFNDLWPGQRVVSTSTHSSSYARDHVFYLHDKIRERYNQTYIISRQISYGSTPDGEDEQGISQVESHCGLSKPRTESCSPIVFPRK